ncbi:ornithine cyclodeaminase family protein [Labedaea rhizosphaerae]|uniref:Ornithine cyclodeaminase n=1 Tax=Labedaea rhizosphaerae TaxID=598644 RepID=A0A4R6RWH7_LABRH|nr:ornithine cyclodeaminase family protein [Labedaea rhizosphaerae]TDP91154.1 ornithine cyclodeaminase [Labedaea rhizosphaerae]
MLIITEDEVENLLAEGAMVDALIDAVAAAMADLSAGRVSLPPRSAALIDPVTVTGLLDMPAYVPSAKALTSKLVSVFPTNAGTAVPVRQAVIVVFDPEDGRPAALVESTHLTAMRTGACSALSARLLARPDASTLAVLGTGVQARAHALTVSRVRAFRELRLAGRSQEKASALARELEGQVPMPIRVCGSFEQAQDGADVVAAATYATEPVVRREWLAPGTHVSSVGYHPRGRELDDATVADALLVVESRAAALNAVPPNRDLADPLASGVITEDHVHAEIGELVAGTATGRTAADQLTLYKSVGVAVQDAAAAALVLRRVGGHVRAGS